MNNIRMSLANEVADRVMGAHGNACERYGMMWGCNGDCPTFAQGLCKMEDVQAFRKAILETKDFSQWEIFELNELYPQLQL